MTTSSRLTGLTTAAAHHIGNSSSISHPDVCHSRPKIHWNRNGAATQTGT